MAAGDRNAVLEPHQLGEQFSAFDDGNLACFRGDALGVVARNRGAYDDRVGALRVRSGMAFKYTGAE